MNEITTTNIADFGMIEIKELKDILDVWLKNGLPGDFYQDEVQFMFNKNSGFVFLTNSEYQVAMINCETGNLESFYNCPECGFEGFKDDFDEDQNECCKEYIKEITN